MRIIELTDATDITGTDTPSGGIIGATSHSQIGLSVVTKAVSGGSVTVIIEGSFDGVTAWDEVPSDSAAITTNTTTNIVADVPTPWYPFYRWRVTAHTATITVDSITISAAGFAGGVDGLR